MVGVEDRRPVGEPRSGPVRPERESDLPTVVPQTSPEVGLEPGDPVPPSRLLYDSPTSRGPCPLLFPFHHKLDGSFTIYKRDLPSTTPLFTFGVHHLVR